MRKFYSFAALKAWGLLVIPVAVALVTALGLSLSRPRGSISHIFLYLLIVSVAASWWGVWLALYASILSLLAVIFFFIPPRGSFVPELQDYDYTSEFLGLIFFITLAVFISYVVSALQKERDRARTLAEREREAKEAVIRASDELEQQRLRSDFLQRARQWLGDTIEPAEVMQKVLDELVKVLGGSVVLVLDKKANPGAANWWCAGQSGDDPEGLLANSNYIMQLRASGQLLGRLGYSFEAPVTEQKGRDFGFSTIRALAEYIAISIENSEMYQTLEFQSNEIARLLRTGLGADIALSKRADQLAVFYRLSTVVISGINKVDLATLGLGEIARVISCTAGAVLFLSEDGKRVELVARRGNLELPEGSSFPLENTLEGNAIGERKTFLYERQDNPAIPCPVIESVTGELNFGLLVPVMSDRVDFGLIIVGTDGPEQYTQDDVEFLEGLAHLMALAFVSSELYRERERTASVEERNRIARDLHDGLAQSINFIGLKTQLIKELYEAGEHEQVQEELERVGKVAELARTDVREVLYGLRHNERGRTLRESLADLVRSAGEMGNIKIRFLADLEQPWPALSITTQIQLLRIAQEALTNVQKHSQASEAVVEVRYLEESGRIVLAIRDNGVGFKPAEMRSRGSMHLGIKVMRERAARLPASLEINSQPGRGSEIIVEYRTRQPVEYTQPNEEKREHAYNR